MNLTCARRFLQRLEQRVERRRGQHVDFVNDVDLVPCSTGTHVGVGTQLANLVDAAIAGPVDLQHVDVFSGIDRPADVAVVVRVRRRAVGGIQRLGENPRRRSLADAASTGEQIGVADAIGVDRVDQRLGHLLLADQVAKRLGAITARHDHVGFPRRGRSPAARPRRLEDEASFDMVADGRASRAREAWCDQRDCDTDYCPPAAPAQEYPA